MAAALPGSAATWLRAWSIVFCTSFCHCSSKALAWLISFSAAAPSGGGASAVVALQVQVARLRPRAGAILARLARPPARADRNRRHRPSWRWRP